MTLKEKFLKADKLWQLLEITIEDLKMAENDPNTIIDMNVWYNKNGTCEVCAAGAVMMRRFHLPAGCHTLHEFNFEIWKRLSAINYLRAGWIYFACMDFYGHSKSLPYDSFIPDYGEKGFWPGLRKLLKFLKKEDI